MKLEYTKKYCDDFLCEYFRIHDLDNIHDLLEEYDRQSKNNPDFKFLITLDDLGQATYTSMHSKMSNDLDGGNWLEKENIDQFWLEDGYPREDLSFKKRFSLRKLGFKHALENSRFEDIFEKRLDLTEDVRSDFFEANKNILSIIDDESFLLKVPVDFYYESIFSFPNGYFTGDLSPTENYYLAEHLEVNYGLYLFGIGASYIAFRKEKGFSNEKIDNLLELLIRIYAEEEDTELYNFLSEQLNSHQLLTLRYTE